MHCIFITGPTASGKSAAAVTLARQLGQCHIISADSRQIYRRMPITTAVPSADERAGITHHLLEALNPEEYYSAARFEQDALAIINTLAAQGHDRVIVCGGSILYIRALLHGLDDLPDISPQVRTQCLDFYHTQGLEALQAEIRRLDPLYWQQADRSVRQNHRRLIHALEIITQTGGQPLSGLRTGQPKPRPFTSELRRIDLPRPQLFDRINRRVDLMVAQGMEQEARSLLPLRRLNALNTVGFKEWFAHFDGLLDRTTAIERIKKNTRVFAKKQLTLLTHLN